MKKAQILWTGGWDSTYRMIELSFRDLTIEPIYVVFESRKSKEKEMKAMEEILEILKKKPRTKAKFLPVKKVFYDEIPNNNEITEAYRRIAKETDLGSQHDWLARLATIYRGMEICIEKGVGDHTPVRDAIYKYGKFKQVKNGEVLDKRHSSKDLMLVFGNFVFPIFQITEQEMVNNIKKWKYVDVMKHIWFCHTPIDGKPCGFCNPCCTKANYKMDFLLPETAQKRNLRFTNIKKKYGIISAKIYRKVYRKFYRGIEKIWN